MAKYTVAERNKMIEKAKKLYIKGFDFAFISEIANVSIRTVENWAREHDFETAKKATSISISEIRNEILSTYAKLRNGETPEMSADQLSKLVSSLEKLNPTSKSITWFLEAFELVTERYLTSMKEAKSEKKKSIILEMMRVFRQHSESIINDLAKELLN